MTTAAIELVGGLADGTLTVVPADDAGKPPYAHCVAVPPTIDWTAPESDELGMPATLTYYRSKTAGPGGVWRYKLAGLRL